MVAEIKQSGAQRRNACRAALGITAWLACVPAHGNPVGPVVVSGQATFASQGKLLAVTNTPGAVVNWQQFSIGAGETTRFIQQSAASAVLNRVVGVDPSRILGTLQSNGRVFLINPSGIIFGAGAQVDVAGLVASTLRLSNEDFLAGRMNFSGDAAPPAAVVNQGRISAGSGGRVVLVGSAVDNQGVITAPNGDIVLAAGRTVRVAERGDRNLQVEVTAPPDRPLNLSEVTYGSSGIYTGLVRNRGVINANSAVRTADGRIMLKAAGDVALAAGSDVSASGARGGTVSVSAGGTATVEGSIAATGDDGNGGRIEISGDRTAILDGARISAGGTTGGGTILVGGDFQGSAIRSGGTELANSRQTFLGRTAELNADAIDSGEGGKVVVWADDATQFYGAVSARGGARGGNGGTVEISGKGALDFQGVVDTRAPRGNAGTLLLDPTDITISVAANTPSMAFGGGTFSDTTITPSNLNVTTLTTQLGSTNVTVSTASARAGNGDITVNDAISYNSGFNLILLANRNITIAAGSGITNIGAGTLTLTGGGAGNIAVNESISTNGGAITLASGSGGVTLANAKSIDAGSGLVSINAGAGAVNLGTGTLQTSNATVSAIAITNATTLALGNVALTGGGILSVDHSGAGSQNAATSISGGGGLTKAGTGTLTLSQANTYTGATTVNAGTLAYGANNVIANGAVTVDGASAVLALGNNQSDTVGTVTVANGGSITGTGTSSLTSTGTFEMQSGSVSAILAGPGIALNKTTAGTVTLSGLNTYSGVTTINAGTLSVNSIANVGGGASALGAPATIPNGTIALSAGTLQYTGTGHASDRVINLTSAGTLDASGSGPLTLTGGVTGNTQNFTLTGTGAGAENGIIATTTGTLTKMGAGTWTLSGASTYTGLTTVNAGTLAYGANDVISTGAVTVDGATAVLALGNNHSDTVGTVTVANGGSVTGTGTSSLTTTGTFEMQAGTVSAILAGAGIALNKTTAGTATLSGLNTYTGVTTISGGILSVNSIANVGGGASALGAPATIANGTIALGAGTLQYTGSGNSSDRVINLSGAGTVDASGSGTLTLTGGVTGNTQTLTLSGSGAGVENGFIATTTGGLTKTGAGTWTLTALNPYTGLTTVNAGTLAYGTSNVISTGPVTVDGATAVLALGNNQSDTVGTVTVANGGSITGTGTSSLTTTGTFEMQAGSVSAILTGPGVALNKTTAGTVTLSGVNTYTGATTINGGVLSVATLANGGAASNIGQSTNAANNLVMGGGTLRYTGATVSIDRNFTLTNGTTSSIDVAAAGANLTLMGAAASTTGALTKLGSGTLTLTAANQYTGLTTVNAGTLAYGASDVIASGPVTVDGATAVLALGNNQSDTVGTVTVANGGSITGTGTSTLTSTGSFEMQSGSVSAILAGTGIVLNKTTAGTVTLSGHNTYTGLTMVSAGTLAYGASDVIATGPVTVDGATAVLDLANNHSDTVGTVTVANGGSITGTGNSTLTSTGSFEMQSGSVSAMLAGAGIPLNKTTAGTVTLSGLNTYTGVTTIVAGTLSVNSIADVGGGASALGAPPTVIDGTIALGAGTLRYTGTGHASDRIINLTGAGTVDASGTGPLTLTGGVTGNGQNLTLTGTGAGIETGVISTAAGTLTKTGTGIWTLTAVNTYGGATNINGGTLRISADSNLGTAPAVPTLAQLTFNGGTLNTTATFTLDANRGMLFNAGGATIDTNPGTLLTYNGAASGVGTLTKTGAGTLLLGGTNTYTGTTTVNGGTLRLVGGSAIVDTGAVVLANNAGVTLDLINSERIGSLAGGGTTGGNVTLNANTLTTGDATNTTFAGVISDAGGLIKEGSGNFTLSGSNTYAGATAVNAGTLTVANNNALGTTAGGTTVAAGATLAINNVAVPTEAVRLNGDGVGANGALTGTGTASLAGGVTLDTASTIGVATGADTLTLTGAIEGPGGLSLVGTGRVVVGNTVGSTAALDSLTQSAQTRLNINGGLVRTANNQTFNGAVTTGGATTLRTTLNGNVSASGTFTAAAGTLTLDTGSGNATFNNVLDDFSTVQVTSGGAVSLVDANSVAIGTANLGALSARALSGNLTLSGNVTASGAGDSIVLAASGNFINTAGAAALNPGAGRWLVYSTNPAADTRGGLVYNFKQYNAIFGVTPVLGTGKGFLYTVAPSVTPSLTGVVTKVYDGTDAATLTPANYSFAGAIDGDTIALGNATAGTYNTKDVGAGKPVSVAGLTLAGASNGAATVYGYQLAGTAASANIGTITPASLTVTANNQAKFYGDSLVLTGTEFTPAGLQNGETIGIVTLASLGTAATAHVVGGPYPIVASAATGGSFNAGNYTISYVNGALTVNPAPLTVTANNQVKAYGTPFTFAGTEFTSSGLKNSEAIGTVTLTSAGAPPTASVAGGPYPILASAATGGSFTTSDYAINYVNGTFTVNPAGVALTVTANNLTKTYGTALVFTGTEFSATGLQNGEVVGTVTLTSAGAAAGAPVTGSPYAIIPSAATGGTFTQSNYTISYVNGALTVLPAALTIRADDKNRLPNTSNPVFTATYTGFKLGETPAALTGTLVFDTTATASSATGSYAIVPSGQTSTNYAITYLDGTLTVAQPASALDGFTNALFAELRRFGFFDFDNDLFECLGRAPGSAAPPGTIRGVATQTRRLCRAKSADLTVEKRAPKGAPQ